MLKELVLKHKNVAFLCNSMDDFIEFINLATDEMVFSKTLLNEVPFYENKEYLLKCHVEGLKKGGINGKPYDGKLYALIIYHDEFQFYSRNYSESEMFGDWHEYEIFNFSLMLRKKKLEKISL